MEATPSSEIRSPGSQQGSTRKFQRNDKIWRRYVERASKHDDKMIEQWTQSIDVLLVSAGLFSAIMTAFLLNASTALQRDTASVTNDLLVIISQQLSSPNNGTFMIPAATLPQQPFVPKRNDIFVCAMLFASLCFCIIAAAGGLLAKLWLLAYRDTVSKPGVAYDRALNRQRAFSGIKAWHANSIIEMLPNLVFFSLILFFLALYASVVEVHWVIAYMIGVLFAAAVTFGFATSVAAAFIPNCPFATPFSGWLRFSLDYVLPGDTLRYAGCITCVCGIVGSGIICLMTFVSTSFSLGLTLPGIAQITMFRDVKTTKVGYPLVGLPLWLAIAITAPVVLFSIAGFFSQFRFIYLGVCFGIGIPWVFQGYFVAKNPGPLISDTVETEALAWYLQEQLFSPFHEFQRAASHADTPQRKIILANSLFPIIASRVDSHMIGHIHSLSKSEVASIVDCMKLLSDFNLQHASFWGNTAAVKCPKGWEQLLHLLDRIPGREEDSTYLRTRLLAPHGADRRGRNDTSRQRETVWV